MITSTPPFSRWKAIVLSALILLLSPAGWGAIGALQMAPLPRELSGYFRIVRDLQIFSMFASLCFVIAVPLAIINDVTVTLVPRCRNNSRMMIHLPRVIFIALLFAALSTFFFRPILHLRYRGLPYIAHNAQPVIRAIEIYKVQNKQYPDALEELVPRYIAAIPYTGAVGFPNYEYDRVIPSKEEQKYMTGETYVLYVSTPLGFLNWDKFLYSPNKEHLQKTYGSSGLLEKFGDWFYLHE